MHCNLWRIEVSHPTCQSSYSSSTHVYSKIRKPTRALLWTAQPSSWCWRQVLPKRQSENTQFTPRERSLGPQEWGCYYLCCYRACAWSRPTGRPVQGISNRLPSPHSDTLPSRVLAHPKPSKTLNKERAPLLGLHATLLDWLLLSPPIFNPFLLLWFLSGF